MANIRNDGKLPVAITQAELIGGDINLRQQDGPFREARSGAVEKFRLSAAPVSMSFKADDAPTVEEGKELAGLYVFPINEPFMIDAKTNYLLSMFRPTVSVYRYGLISKSFSSTSNNGKAQRSYRLTSDRYLSNGNCIIRENSRVVGETSFPNLAAADKHEFSIGEDADVVYEEKVTMISMKTYNETQSKDNKPYDKETSPVIIITRTQYIYEIQGQVKNFKTRPINVEYEQKGFYGYETSKLTKSNKGLFIQDGSSIKSNITLNANTNEIYSYTIELVR